MYHVCIWALARRRYTTHFCPAYRYRSSYCKDHLQSTNFIVEPLNWIMTQNRRVHQLVTPQVVFYRCIAMSSHFKVCRTPNNTATNIDRIWFRINKALVAWSSTMRPSQQCQRSESTIFVRPSEQCLVPLGPYCPPLPPPRLQEYNQPC